MAERGKLGTTLIVIVEALADKYLEHQPIERRFLRWSRAGVDVAPQTLGRSVGAAIDALAPIARMIDEQTRAPGLLATDATGHATRSSNRWRTKSSAGRYPRA